MSDWIPIDEQRPEIGVPVWCLCFEDYPQRGWHTEAVDYGEEGMSYWFKNDYDKYIMVTHWMPISPAPEGRDQ